MAARACDRPRIRVAGLMPLGGRVVLVRHRAGDRTYHLLPGGGVSWGETLVDALTREFFEETGLQCRVGRPVLLSDTIAPDGQRHVVNITFACEHAGGTVTASPSDPRVEAVDLVPLDELRTLDLRPPIAEHIAECLRDPDRAARYVQTRYVSD